MKLVAIFLISCLVCTSTGFSLTEALLDGLVAQFGINDLIKEMLEGTKKHFPCGIAQYGIPVLEPLHVQQLSLSIKSLTQLSSLEFRATDTNVYHLSGFEVDHANLNVMRLTLDLNMTFPELKITGKHDTTAWLLDRLPIKIVGTGDYTLVLKKLKVAVSVMMNTISGKLNVRDLNVVVSLDELDSDVRGILGGLTTWSFNRILEKVVPTIIEEQQELINQKSRELVMPVVNRILNNLTLIDLMNLIAEAVNNPREPEC